MGRSTNVGRGEAAFEGKQGDLTISRRFNEKKIYENWGKSIAGRY